MKILFVADHELDNIWTHWETAGKKRLEGVDLILSAGDIKASYLEFLVTMLGVPCLYVRGNHDQMYQEQPPRGCVCIEDGVIEVIEYEDSGKVMLKEEALRGKVWNSLKSGEASSIGDKLRLFRYAIRRAAEIDPAGVKTYRIAGLGGSMRYREGPDMYTEREMRRRTRRLTRQIKRGIITRVTGKKSVSRDLADNARREGPAVDILLTHAPCKGYGDLEDLAHTGFDCFNRLLEDLHPRYLCYGHVHMEYGMIRREAEHPSGTHLINVSGMYLLEI